MDITIALQWPLDADVDLSFDRTIDRRQVHRSAVAEVFLTDARTIDDQRVVLAGQLPTCHAYFNDHAHHATAVDPLLVMEVGRQATLATAHQLGVPGDVVLISEEFELSITDPDAWRAGGPGTRVRLDSEFTWTRMRRGRPRAGVCVQRMYVDGQPAASHRSSGHLMTREELELLRAAQRGTPAPWTADLVDAPDPQALPPALVGRRDPLNVVLAGLRRDEHRLVARVAPRLSNRALFDHSYDHLTMHVLTEAARQLALAAVSDGSASTLTGWQLTAVVGRFTRFAELDAVVTVQAPVPATTSGEVRVQVIVDQDGDTVAQVDVTFTSFGGRS